MRHVKLKCGSGTTTEAVPALRRPDVNRAKFALLQDNVVQKGTQDAKNSN